MKITFRYKEYKMNIILMALTITTLGICGPDASSIKEDLVVKKDTNCETKKTVPYKKVPTKWVKIPKKSN
jgi:hypothetical protein|tara:strand:+ start:368 stop:577 length:210 start_codon:yes stop_codon:yes gene_type:complete